METTVENVVEVEANEDLVDKVCDFVEDHPLATFGILGLTGVALLASGLALYGNIVGRIAGRSAAKTLVDMGFKVLV